MNNQIQVFNNSEFGQIRTITINNEPWFIGKDVAEALGYVNGSRDINRHVNNEDRQNYQDCTFESPRGMTIINESGLYKIFVCPFVGRKAGFIMTNLTNININELVQIQNNQAVTDSRTVAEAFGKEHRNVTATIRDILVAEKSAARFFYETTYENRGKQYPCYYMNRDGFSLLVMGFSGKEALAWKIKYINAFNQMEEQVKKQSIPSNPTQIMAEELKATENVINSLEKMGVDTAHARLLALKIGLDKTFKILDTPTVQTIIQALPPAESPDVGMLTPTDIAKRYSDLYNEKITARMINIILENNNLQNKTNGKWTATEKGKQYASMMAYTNQVSGHNGWQLKWKSSVMNDILNDYMEDIYGNIA